MSGETAVEMTTTNNTTTTKPLGEPDATLSAAQLTTLAKASLTAGEFESAIDLFGKALQAKIAETGNELSPDCAGMYFDYGDAMLQHCSQKSDVFGGAIRQAQMDVAAEVVEEAANEDGAEDADKEDADNENANEEVNDVEVTKDAANEDAKVNVSNEEASDNVANVEAEDNVANEETNNNVAEDETKPTVATTESAVPDDKMIVNEEEQEEEEEGEQPDEEDIDNADEPSDLEVAWELLETARVIYSRMPTDKVSVVLGLADCYSRLGDVALENDTDAQTDYAKGLDALNSLKDDEALSQSEKQIKYRSIGSILFKMAIANTISGDSKLALTQFKEAQMALTKCVEFFLGPLTISNGKSEAGSDAVPFEAIRQAMSAQPDNTHIQELVDFLQQIQDKIEDIMASEPIAAAEVTTMVTEVMADAAAAADSAGGFQATSSSDNVTNLGTLVGEKRKVEVADDEQNDLQNKKVLKQ